MKLHHSLRRVIVRFRRALRRLTGRTVPQNYYADFDQANRIREIVPAILADETFESVASRRGESIEAVRADWETAMRIFDERKPGFRAAFLEQQREDAEKLSSAYEAMEVDANITPAERKVMLDTIEKARALAAKAF